MIDLELEATFVEDRDPMIIIPIPTEEIKRASLIIVGP
jgi:hypothetical protein